MDLVTRRSPAWRPLPAGTYDAFLAAGFSYTAADLMTVHVIHDSPDCYCEAHAIAREHGWPDGRTA